MKNTFTVQELQTVIQAMTDLPGITQITLRPGATAGLISKDEQGNIVFTPTHFNDTWSGWRD